MSTLLHMYMYIEHIQCVYIPGFISNFKPRAAAIIRRIIILTNKSSLEENLKSQQSL